MKVRNSKLIITASGFLRCALAAACCAVAPATQATDAFWTNSGTINAPLQIDAVNFVNSGTMAFSTLAGAGGAGGLLLFSGGLPFETSNTRNFTNSGLMVSVPGWLFANSPSGNGERKLADNFYNAPSGEIRAQDPFGTVILGLGGNATDPSYLWVNATNIINRGLLSVGANGWLKLTGTNVNLVRSGVEVTAISPQGSQNGQSNFFPDAGITDVHWGTTNMPLPPGRVTSGIWRSSPVGGVATTPPHPVRQRGGLNVGQFGFSVTDPFADTWAATNAGITVTFTNLVGVTNAADLTNLSLTNFVITNIFVPTNITRQAAFAAVSDPTIIGVGFTWYPSTSPTNFYMTPEISMTMIGTNVVLGSPELLSLYLYDTLAAEDERGLLQNVTSTLNNDTFRPTNYILSRLPVAFGFGLNGNGYPENNFLYDPQTYSNNLVAMDLAGYGAFVNNLPSGPPVVPAGTFTNLPGRAQIYANNLDLTRTRIKGEGHIIVKTDNLISSSNAVVDSEHLSFTLKSAVPRLTVQNLAKESVVRMRGNLRVWSGRWANELSMIETNNWLISTNFDTNTPPNVVSYSATNAPVTNSAVLGLAATILDASGVLGTWPVQVWDMVTRDTPNVTINDRMSLVQNFFMDAESFTLNGALTFSNATLVSWIGTVFASSIEDWTATNAPNLKFFTNNGTLVIPNRAHFGDDTLVPYSTFVNTGQVFSSSLSISSSFFYNSGDWNIFGPMVIRGQEGVLQDGTSQSSDTFITAGSLRLNNYALASGTLNLDVSGNLADAGPESGNVISTVNGFKLARKPTTGDLLGTTINSELPAFVQVDHVWAGEDRGATTAGFVNNVALGSLVIGPVGQGSPLAWFGGASGQSALYVEVLDISALGDQWEGMMEIAPNLTIYYATARIGFTPPNAPNGQEQLPEEFLDGKFGGRLVWVDSYAGAFSSVTILVDGTSVQMNTALRDSKVIDSDNDGVPNFFDATPLGGSSPGNVASAPILLKASYTAGTASSAPVSFSWTAEPNTAYDVEVATDLLNANWQPFATLTNESSTTQTLTFSDTEGASIGHRFFRVRAK